MTQLWRPTIAILAPAAAVLAVLALLEALTVKLAIAAFILVAVGAAFIVRLFLADVSAVVNYAEQVSDSLNARRPRLMFSDMFIPLLVGIRRLARSASEASRAREDRANISGLDHLPEPVLMLDETRRVIIDNAAARDLLGTDLVGRDLAAVIRNPVVLDAVDSLVVGDRTVADVEFSFQVPVERQFSARVARVTTPDADPIAMVIALHDMTQLKRAEQMRSDFVANASHELRTPISVILGCIQTLGSSARDDPEAQKEFIALMEGQAVRMGTLVEDLLSLSGIEQKEHTVPSESVDVGQIVQQVVSDLALQAEMHNITTVIDCAKDIPPIAGDKNDLYRALQNLVDNALKYGGEDSTVSITAKLAEAEQIAKLPRERSYVAIAVRDQGEGVPPEHVARLTERFYRVDTVRSRQLGGTGLGLAIVKHVVNRHRGTLLIDSEVDRGSVFTLVLPAYQRPADGQAETGAQADQRPTPESA